MKYARRELLPGVWLTTLQTDKFKSACLSITMLTDLTQETAAANAVLPYVLRRGTRSWPDMRALSEELQTLYGASIEPVVRKYGEIQCIGFQADFCEDAYLPGEPGVLESIAALLGELLLAPNTRGGQLLPDYVDSEREKLIEQIDSLINNKRQYAIRRLMEEMCAYEPYSVYRLGAREEAEDIRYLALSKHLREIISASPIELFYCGSRSINEVASLLKQTLISLPRGEINYELGTDIRMNAVEDKPRYFTEELPVTQGNLAVGFRLGACMDDPDLAAIRVFNAVFGGCTMSKLFMNVREKLSLCYYASSAVDLHKGLLYVSSGIEFSKYDDALREILAQLDAIRRGEISNEELDAAKKSVANSLISVADAPDSLESFYLSHTILGTDASPEELAEAVGMVTREEIVSIAGGVELDAVYFLRGEEAE